MATVSMKIRSSFVGVAIVLLLEAGQAAGKPFPVPSPPPIPGSNCNCGVVTVVCSEATSLTRSDKVIPWVTFVFSVLLFLIPNCIRALRLSQVRLGIRHTSFTWYLLLSVADYVWWIFYSWPCKYGQATFPIKLTSFFGVIIHLMFVWLMLFKLVTHVAIVRCSVEALLAVISGVIGSVIVSAAADAAAIFGWIGMGLAVFSHFFRIKSTDYDTFDGILFVASVVGTVNGCLWLHHPNLCVARQYKITSYLIAALRGFETLQWLWPWIGYAMTKLQGGPEVPVVPAGNSNVNRGNAD